MLIDELDKINDEIIQFGDKHISNIQNKIDELKTLSNLASNLDDSWSQSWIGYQSNLYYLNFKAPPVGHHFDSEWGLINGIPESWTAISYDAIVKYIESKSNGLKLQTIDKEVSPLLEEAIALQQNFLIVLCLFEEDERFAKEFDLIKEIKSHRWGAPANDLISVRMPKNYITRDTFALSKGIQTPPHILYDCRVISTGSRLKSILEFINKSINLIKRLKLKIKYSQNHSSTMITNSDDITNIFDKFHTIAISLRDRPRKKIPILMDDEYDVQYILRALLELNFDIIKPEEPSPSSASSYSNIDFLLQVNGEKIGIETKRSRSTLSPQQLKDAILRDINDYKGYGLSKLYFFIYDPEHLYDQKIFIKDLNGAKENMDVCLYFSPKLQ